MPEARSQNTPAKGQGGPASFAGPLHRLACGCCRAMPHYGRCGRLSRLPMQSRLVIPRGLPAVVVAVELLLGTARRSGKGLESPHVSTADHAIIDSPRRFGRTMLDPGGELVR